MQNACSSQVPSTSEIAVPDSLHTDTRIRPLRLHRRSHNRSGLPLKLCPCTVAAIIHHAPRSARAPELPPSAVTPRFALPTGVSSMWADRVSQVIRIVHACQPRTSSSPTNQACVSNVLTDVPLWLCPWLCLNEVRRSSSPNSLHL
jgi:hypothetical protein